MRSVLPTPLYINMSSFAEAGQYVQARNVFPHVNQPGIEQTPPTFNGSVDEFVQSFADKLDDSGMEKLQRQTKNKTKKCANCGKACAYTLTACNQCGSELVSVAITYTNNIFTSFIYGIAKGPFPFIISLRQQTDNILVFDDLLALTTCHLNCIPTDVYVPDLRSLFEDPARGRALLVRMKDESTKVLRQQFLNNQEWRLKLLKDSTSISDEEICSHVCAGLNFPPSQYQLHLQFMLPPFTPYHWNVYKNGGHFTSRRFFPIEYMLEALEAMGTNGILNASSLDIDMIIDQVKEQCGVDYEVVYQKCYARYGESHIRLSNWSSVDFKNELTADGVLMEKRSGESSESGESDESGEAKTDGAASLDMNAVAAEDKMVLQNYGRPYDEGSGRPSGTFYKFTKAPPLPEWV